MSLISGSLRSNGKNNKEVQKAKNNFVMIQVVWERVSGRSQMNVEWLDDEAG